MKVLIIVKCIDLNEKVNNQTIVQLNYEFAIYPDIVTYTCAHQKQIPPKA